MLNWREIIVKGNEKTLRGFVSGFEAGSGNKGCVIFGRDFDLENESLSELIHDLFSAGSHHLLFADALTAAKLIDALRERGDDVELEVTNVANVLRVSLAFKIAAFAEDTVAVVRRVLLESLPKGVEVVEFEENVAHDDEAKTTGVYAPVHHYTYNASGTFIGPLPGILEMRRRANESEFVTVEQIKLERR